MKKFVQQVLPVLLVCFTTLAFGQNKPSNNLSPKKFSDIMAKQRCVKMVADDEFSKSMSKFGITASGLCTCIQEEMDYLVSDSLAFKTMAVVAKGNSKVAITEEDDRAVADWNNLFANSFRSCASKLKRLD